MKGLLFLLPLALVACTDSAIDPTAKPPLSTATAPGLHKLTCFDGTTDGGFGGTCLLNSNGASGSATLILTSTNPSGDYAGAYVANTHLDGQMLSSVTMLGYRYTGIKTPTPTELSLNLPIDTNDDGVRDFYAFIDAAYCGGATGYVNIVHDANCGIYAGSTVFYANWAEFVAAYPGAKVTRGELPFIIAERVPADVPQAWVVRNVTMGASGK